MRLEVGGRVVVTWFGISRCGAIWYSAEKTKNKNCFADSLGKAIFKLVPQTFSNFSVVVSAGV